MKSKLILKGRVPEGNDSDDLIHSEQKEILSDAFHRCNHGISGGGTIR